MSYVALFKQVRHDMGGTRLCTAGAALCITKLQLLWKPAGLHGNLTLLLNRQAAGCFWTTAVLITVCSQCRYEKRQPRQVYVPIGCRTSLIANSPHWNIVLL